MCFKKLSLLSRLVSKSESFVSVPAGSPFTVKIGGEPSAKITERITRHKAAADVTHVGSQCELSLKIPGEFICIYPYIHVDFICIRVSQETTTHLL